MSPEQRSGGQESKPKGREPRKVIETYVNRASENRPLRRFRVTIFKYERSEKFSAEVKGPGNAVTKLPDVVYHRQNPDGSVYVIAHGDTTDETNVTELFVRNGKTELMSSSAVPDHIKNRRTN